MAVEPTDQLLEIGCGPGVAVSLVCEKLYDGNITAIDRSAKMIETARKRNADHVAAGVASFRTVSLHQAASTAPGSTRSSPSTSGCSCEAGPRGS